MRIKQQYIYYGLFSMFMLYGLNGYIFERKLYFNEILSLAGILIFTIKISYNSENLKVKIPESAIYRLVLGIIGLASYQMLVSVFTNTSWYYYFRNSAILYSMFTFFIGFYGFKYFRSFLDKARIFLIVYLLYGLILPSNSILDRFHTAAFFPLIFKKFNWVFFIIILVLNFVLAKQYESMTGVFVALLLMSIYFIPKYKLFKKALLLGLIVSIIGAVYFSPYLAKYTDREYSLYGNTHRVMESHSLLSKDGNSTWRAVFWYRLITERFPQNIIGIGFGTPLLDYVEDSNTAISGGDDENDIHVTGGHNTYLTLTVRLGILYLVLMTLVFRVTFKEFYLHKAFYLEKEYLYLFVSFFTIAIIGLFNLLIESPMGASLFWVFLGLVAAAIEQRKTDLLPIIV